MQSKNFPLIASLMCLFSSSFSFANSCEGPVQDQPVGIRQMWYLDASYRIVSADNGVFLKTVPMRVVPDAQSGERDQANPATRELSAHYQFLFAGTAEVILRQTSTTNRPNWAR